MKSTPPDLIEVQIEISQGRQQIMVIFRPTVLHADLIDKNGLRFAELRLHREDACSVGDSGFFFSGRGLAIAHRQVGKTLEGMQVMTGLAS